MDKYRVSIWDGGRKIAAIKALRAATHREGQGCMLGLKESKDIVESGFDGHFTVVMTKDQAFSFLLCMTTDNEGFVKGSHMRICDISKIDAQSNDISNL